MCYTVSCTNYSRTKCFKNCKKIFQQMAKLCRKLKWLVFSGTRCTYSVCKPGMLGLEAWPRSRGQTLLASASAWGCSASVLALASIIWPWPRVDRGQGWDLWVWGHFTIVLYFFGWAKMQLWCLDWMTFMFSKFKVENWITVITEWLCLNCEQKIQRLTNCMLLVIV